MTFSILLGRPRTVRRKTSPVSALDLLKQLIDSIDAMHLISLVGIGLFATWLIRTSLGRKSLVHSRPRRNDMSPIMPFAAFAVWFLGGYALQTVAVTVSSPFGDEAEMLANHVAFCVAAVLTLGVVLPLAQFHFARGLKGFGLSWRTLPRDLGGAVVKLLALWPLVLAAIVVTTKAGRIVEGHDFEMPQHQELEVMTEFPDVYLQVLIVFLAVVIAPVLEETLFRGLFQSVIRSYVNRPWLAIAATSVLFAAVHGQSWHWPALFVLSLGLGYACERSGSLFQPIFMHAFFNGTVIAAALLG